MTVTIIQGDARHLDLPDESVDLIVTSPPYWRLRDYRDGQESLAGQLGSEATPGEYIANLLECTREWTRVLKPEGSIFINLGDKYSQPGKGERNMQGIGGTIVHQVGARQANVSATGISYDGVPGKSLLGLPWRYAIGCVDSLSLILRAEIVWQKANGLPESVQDRVRRSHEQVFHFTSQPRYYAAVDEIRETYADGTAARYAAGFNPGREAYAAGGPTKNGVLRHDGGGPGATNPLGKLPGSVWEIPSAPLIVPERVAHARCCGGIPRPDCADGLTHYAAFPPELARRIIAGWSPPGICTACGEGRRPVAIPAGPAGRHPGGGGTYRAIRQPGQKDTNLAGAALQPRVITGYACACTPYTGHPGSGKPTPHRDYNPAPDGAHAQGTYGRKQAGEYERVGPWREYHLDGWTPPPTRRATVLDPFGGTGTTAMVADLLGRDGISVDLSADYCDLARWRTTDPGERARALGLPKPQPVPQGQDTLFDLDGAS